MAFAPDATLPLGGHAVSHSEPGNREKGQQMMNQLDPAKTIEDFIAAVEFLKTHPATTGKVGVVGFCWGGVMTNTLAVRVPDLACAVPFHGAQPAAADVPKIKAPLLIHYAGLDERLNKGWPAYEATLKAAGKTYTAYIYEGAQHAFHNDDDGPRYNKAAAGLAWQRTLDFLNNVLFFYFLPRNRSNRFAVTCWMRQSETPGKSSPQLQEIVPAPKTHAPLGAW